jgi:hypothetical protein
LYAPTLAYVALSDTKLYRKWELRFAVDGTLTPLLDVIEDGDLDDSVRGGIERSARSTFSGLIGNGLFSRSPRSRLSSGSNEKEKREGKNKNKNGVVKKAGRGVGRGGKERGNKGRVPRISAQVLEILEDSSVQLIESAEIRLQQRLGEGITRVAHTRIGRDC